MLSPLVANAALRWLERLQPNQGGALWIAVLTTIVLAFDFRKPISWRNVDLVLLLALGFLLVDLLDLGGGGVATNPGQRALFGTVFLGVFLLNAVLLARALIGAFSREGRRWTPNVSEGALAACALVLILCNVLLAVGREPDDSGYCVNRGAARMRVTGNLPYGDTGMGWCGAIYGPLLYVVHVPLQMSLLEIDPVPATAPAGDVAATHVAVVLFHALGVISLFCIGWAHGGRRVGLGLVCLYAGSAYVQGLGGEQYLLTGMTHISHIAPTAVTLAAFAALNRPAAAGSLLALAAGVLFYPVFFFPLWFGYYFWRGHEWRRFAAGFLAVSAATGIAVWWLTPAGPGGLLQTLLDSTVGDHEAPSAFGFWGTHPRLAEAWETPLVSGWYLLKPSAIAFWVFLSGTFFLVRGRTVPQLALLTAAVAIAVQLWKSHAGGTYVEWYYPFFLIGLLVGGASDAGAPAEDGSS